MFMSVCLTILIDLLFCWCIDHDLMSMFCFFTDQKLTCQVQEIVDGLMENLGHSQQS